MNTYFFSKEELEDLKLHDFLLKRYIVQVVCKRLSLDLTKGVVSYDIAKAELYYADNPKPQPKPEVKPEIKK